MPFLDRIFDYKIVICMAKTLKHLLDLLEPTSLHILLMFTYWTYN